MGEPLPRASERPSISLSKMRAMPILVSAEHATVPSSEAEGGYSGRGFSKPAVRTAELNSAVRRGRGSRTQRRWGYHRGKEDWETEERPQCRGRYVSSACFGFGTGDRWHNGEGRLASGSHWGSQDRWFIGESAVKWSCFERQRLLTFYLLLEM